MQKQASERRLKVLIVDDNAEFAESLCVLVTAWGHECSIVADGEKALVAVEQDIPDLIILDILMPYLDGIETGRALRAQITPASLVIVAISAWAQNLDKALAEAEVFNHRLMKPVSNEELAQILERAALALN